MVRRSALVLIALALAGSRAVAGPPPVGGLVRDGDLVFQSSQSAQSQAIALATRSRWTHLGVVHLRKGKPWVFEAAARVQLTPLDRWVARGQGRVVVVKRLRDAGEALTPAVLTKMGEVGRGWMGRPYDGLFRWSDDRFYCSELVYKLYREGAGITIGQPQPAGSFALDSPEVQAKIRERFGARFDAREPVISPQAMFEDARLVTVFEGVGR